MRNFISASITLSLLLVAQLAYASGQRTVVITTKSVNEFPLYDLATEPTREAYLHYLGSVDNRFHLLSITKTAYPRETSNSDKPVHSFRPMDHTFTYRVSSRDMIIENGWSLDQYIKDKGIEIRPPSCPRFRIGGKAKKYRLPAGDKLKTACLGKH